MSYQHDTGTGPPGAYMGGGQRQKGRWAKILIIPLALILLFLIGLIFVARPYVVHGVSMEPTVHPGDRVLVIKYQFGRTPDRDDIVVLKSNDGGGDRLIKRVIAISGDFVSIKRDKIVVNGEKTYHNTVRSGVEERDIQVPRNHIFVRGDNESVSYDSRSFGPVPMDRVAGKAVFIFWPLNHMDFI